MIHPVACTFTKKEILYVFTESQFSSLTHHHSHSQK